jgi:hypothetical protein
MVDVVARARAVVFAVGGTIPSQGMGVLRRTFSLTEGGPTYRLLHRLGLVKRDGGLRGLPLALLAWLPLLVGESIRSAMGRPPDPAWRDLSVHVRLLLALPTMLLAERLVDTACRSAVHSLYVGRLAEGVALDRVVEGGERLRDAGWPEAVCLLAALVGGQLALWEVTGAAGLFHGATGRRAWSFPHLWYDGFALPLFQFFMYRWLWRWAIWSVMLVRIARLPLAPIATHPDRAAGLAALARPVSAFSFFGLAIGAVLAGAFGSQLIAHRTTVRSLLPELLVLLLVLAALATAPLLLFCGHLYRVRWRELAQYGDFATGYMRAFHHKWIEPGSTPDTPLGSPDIQSLADLGSAFEVILHTQLFVFGIRHLVGLWSATLLPMVPLLASQLTVEQLLRRIASALLGGLPL